MLSRVANNFYWMGRYVERASCISRFLLVQMNEIPEDSPNFVSVSWKGIFDSLKIPMFKDSTMIVGEEKVSDDFLLADAYTLVDHLTFETYHPWSILSCLTFARENARQNQGKISSLMWPHINKTYLRVKQISLKDLWPDKIIDLYKNILDFSYLFYGLTQDSLYQDEAVHFIQTGQYLERFQNTASLFENHIRSIMSHKEEEEDLIGLLLRCGAFDNYRQIHSLNLKFRKVTDFLLYNSCFSGSLQFCNDKIKSSLFFIEGKKESNSSIYRSLKKIEEQLKNSNTGQPLAQFLNSLHQESFRIGAAIDTIYMNYKSMDSFVQSDQ